MFNIKATVWLAAAALMLTVLSPVAKAVGMAPNGNFVSLRVNGSHVAYGLILSPTKILVPAHAVGGAVSSYTILAGANDRAVVSCGTCQLRSALSSVRHPSYNTGGSYSNDVAIIRVAALTFNSTVFAGTIAPSFANTVGTQFTQIGFGANGTNYNRLQTTVTTPWTLATMPGYVFTLGDFVTATVAPNPAAPIAVNGMINYYNSGNQTQVYTKLSDFATWINAN
jgi:hypothetical protein